MELRPGEDLLGRGVDEFPPSVEVTPAFSSLEILAATIVSYVAESLNEKRVPESCDRSVYRCNNFANHTSGSISPYIFLWSES